jgi:NDP-sugar pyrophosphorylase family protein
LRNCADLITDTAILYNGDILTDLDIGDLVSFHKRTGARITATFNEVDDPTHYGVPELDAQHRVLGWQEKPSRETAKSRYGNVGVWVVEPDIFSHIPDARAVSLETEVFPLLLRDGVPFFGYCFDGYWKDIGTIAKYVDANRDVLTGKVRDQDLDEKRAGEELWVGHDVRLPESCEISGSVVIGAGTTIGEAVRILGPTVIGANCVIGEGVEMACSVIWSGARIAARTRVDSAVIGAADIGADCVIRAGSVVSSDSRLAANSYLPPDSLLGPGSSLAIGRS